MRLLLTTSAFAVLALSSVSAAAQAAPIDESDGQATSGHVALEDIVVTAQRRSTNLQDTPAAITAITSEMLEQQPLTDALQLGQRVPALVLTHRFGVLQAAIRGVSGQDFALGGDPRVAFHIDGIYVARGAAQVSGLYDVERVEVIQGPQGALYGRNATAGAINIITKAPTEEMSGYVRQTIGNYGLLKTDAAISLPITDGLSGRIATEIVNRNGFGRDVFLSEDIDDQKSKAVRARLRWDRGPLQVDLIGDYYDRRDRAFSAYYAGFIRRTPTQPAPPFITATTIVPTGRREVSSDVLPFFHERTKGLALNIKYELDDNLTLQSLSGFRDNMLLQYADGDNTNFLFSVGASREESKTFSQEFQLNGDYEGTKFTVGAYGFDENIHAGARISRGVGTTYRPAAYSDARLYTRAYAIFGTLTQDFADAFHVTFGGRYTWETKSARRGRQGLLVPGTPVPAVTDFGQSYWVPDSLLRAEESKTWRKFTPSVTLQYDFSPDVMAYATYAVGFKSGGYNSADLLAPVNPEIVKDYEAGLKADLFDRRLRANLSLFYYDYTDLQVSKGTIIGGQSFLQVTNAAAATSYGGQIELEAQVSDRLRLRADALFVDSTFDFFSTTDAGLPPLSPEVDLSGFDLPQSPPYKISVAADYVLPVANGDVTLHAQSTFTGKFYTSVYNLEETAAPAAAIVDLSIHYAMDNGISASLWVNNLTDRLTIGGVSPGNFLTGNPLNISYGPPRTYGVTLGYKW